MKSIVVVLALVALAYAAPQPRKLFHEHFEDFLDVIGEKSKKELDILLIQYFEYEEFRNGIEYINSNDFKSLIQELESLPEFVAVTEFLEGHNIDISYFIDILNNIIGSITSRKTRQEETPGRDISAFIKDSIELFPKDDLIALYETKMAEDELFRNAMTDFESEEWDALFDTLWQNETFIEEFKDLLDNGINVHVLLREIKAVFGKFE